MCHTLTSPYSPTEGKSDPWHTLSHIHLASCLGYIDKFTNVTYACFPTAEGRHYHWKPLEGGTLCGLGGQDFLPTPSVLHVGALVTVWPKGYLTYSPLSSVAPNGFLSTSVCVPLNLQSTSEHENIYKPFGKTCQK